nr:CHAD domain-containing protein [Hyphomicrobium sp.]
MPYRFNLDEKFASAFRRIVREQVGIASAELSSPTISAGSIHQTRKAIKRVRALLRSAAPVLGPKAARKHDRAFRDIARRLSSQRDADVIEATITSLESHFGSDAVTSLRPLRIALESRPSDAVLVCDAQAIQGLRDDLKAEGKRLRKLRLQGHGLATAVAGIGATYDVGRRALKRAIKRPTDNNVHDLRKAVQAHWRHMSLLSRSWPEEFAARVAAARELSQLLGDDHDLSLVKTAAQGLTQEADVDGATPAAPIIDLCNQRQAALRAEMAPRAVRLYAEDRGGFERRIAIYWKMARRIAETAQHSDKTDAPQIAVDKPN